MEAFANDTRNECYQQRRLDIVIVNHIGLIGAYATMGYLLFSNRPSYTERTGSTTLVEVYTSMRLSILRDKLGASGRLASVGSAP